MATFRVGQRVRLIHNGRPPGMRGPLYNGQSSVGRECTIIGPLRWGNFYSGAGYAYPIDIDGLGRVNDFGHQSLAKPEWLQPIQPERNQVIAWSECLWQPTKETA